MRIGEWRDSYPMSAEAATEVGQEREDEGAGAILWPIAVALGCGAVAAAAAIFWPVLA